MPENEGSPHIINGRFISIDSIISALADFPETQALIQIIQPFIPLIIREGQNAYNDFVMYASDGRWAELDNAMWEKMTEDERDLLSNKVLMDARIAVDNQFQREKLAKQITIKIVTSLLSVLLL